MRCTVSEFQYRWSFPPVCLAVVVIVLSNCGVAVIIKVLWGCFLMAPHHNLGIAGISQLEYIMCWKGSYTKLKACFKTLSMAFACILAQLMALQQPPLWLPPPLSASLGRGCWKLFKRQGVKRCQQWSAWLGLQTYKLKSVDILIVRISFTFLHILNWSVATEMLTDTCDWAVFLHFMEPLTCSDKTQVQQLPQV